MLSAVSENLNIYQQQIKEMIYKFDISSVNELEERYSKNSENERVSMEIKGLLQGDTIEGIRERVGLLNSEIKDIKESGSDEFMEVTNTERRLSTGAMQQLYFATRLAIIDILTRNRKLPLILDDPFL